MCKSVRTFGRKVDYEIYGRKKIKKDWIVSKKKKKHKLKKLSKNTKYSFYITSPQWEKRKQDFYSKHKKECYICETKKYITLHHSVYSNWGEEKDKNLVPLCWTCHKEVHNITINDKTVKLKNSHEIYKELFNLRL